MPYEQLIAVARCHKDKGTFVEYDGLELAVFVSTNQRSVVITDNTCPHSSGNLSAGEHRDGLVVCPLHQWEFDDQTGVCTRSAKARVRVYPSRIEEGHVWIDRPNS
ncbi:MAG: Rieske (2Fe-2S) protein [Planctomycetota bacterium]|jgi:nitrite reductase/ring-hydroxylating ferredoxin subunit